MPELPEVEVARRNLALWLEGARVVGARVHDRRVVRGASGGSLARSLVDRRVLGVSRRGKWLRITLDDGQRVFSHLGMTGKWVLRPSSLVRVRFERARLDVTLRGRRRSVRYLDPRLFGRIVVAANDISQWVALGPDPLTDGIDVDALAASLARRKRSIKEAIMDQSILAGIGNIQATEALWRARIDPRTRSDRVTRGQLVALARAIRATIAAALADAWGAEPAPRGREITYVEEAGAPNPFRIYGRAGTPCPRCRRQLQRIVLGGRGTVLCPHCQHAI
jgi:formamidopyrimidine-DNA glycosylase